MNTKNLTSRLSFVKENPRELDRKSHLKNGKILLTEHQIHKCVMSVAKKLNKLASENKDKEIILVGLLKEVYIFMADLSRNINFDHSLEFFDICFNKNYFVYEIKSEFIEKIKKNSVIIIVIDTLYGKKLEYITNLLKEYTNSKSRIISCALIKKEKDFSNSNLIIGYNEMPDLHLFGYGLGLKNLIGVYTYTNEVKSKECYINMIQKIQKDIRYINN